jgi:hypothetical protein
MSLAFIIASIGYMMNWMHPKLDFNNLVLAGIAFITGLLFQILAKMET